jgi:enoyl-[acyl-carrier protein] reductase/trans-2-enoyl-CoA reductase (NAD+)
MIIKPKFRGFICLTSHPEGCYKNVEDDIKKSKSRAVSKAGLPSGVLVIGGSTGYGLASRIASLWSLNADVLSVSFERGPLGSRTGTAGYYNDIAVSELAKKDGKRDISLNGDAFSNEMKREVINTWKNNFSEKKIGLVVYSLASPKRKDPNSDNVYSSVIKPIGQTYTNKTVDFHTGEVSEISISPANDSEISDTIKVMGGEDWELWINSLLEADLLAENVKTIAYSYVGPALTHPIYKDGTIGRAKEDLFSTSERLTNTLRRINGRGLVSVNKALVTQSSSAIPVVPLYISLLFKVMKEKGVHEDTTDQILRLFNDKLYQSDASKLTNPIRIDELEMGEDIQKEVAELWTQAASSNIYDISDLKGYEADFFKLFGFCRSDVDYEADVDIL